MKKGGISREMYLFISKGHSITLVTDDDRKTSVTISMRIDDKTS